MTKNCAAAPRGLPGDIGDEGDTGDEGSRHLRRQRNLSPCPHLSPLSPIHFAAAGFDMSVADDEELRRCAAGFARRHRGRGGHWRRRLPAPSAPKKLVPLSPPVSIVSDSLCCCRVRYERRG